MAKDTTEIAALHPQKRNRREACDKPPEQPKEEVVGLSRKLAVLIENLKKIFTGKTRDKKTQKLAHDELLSVEEKFHESIIQQTKRAYTKRDGQGIVRCAACLCLMD